MLLSSMETMKQQPKRNDLRRSRFWKKDGIESRISTEEEKKRRDKIKLHSLWSDSHEMTDSKGFFPIEKDTKGKKKPVWCLKNQIPDQSFHFFKCMNRSTWWILNNCFPPEVNPLILVRERDECIAFILELLSKKKAWLIEVEISGTSAPIHQNIPEQEDRNKKR